MFSLPSTLLRQIAQTHGTPLYVYDLDHIRNRVSDLRIALGGHFKISYAMKANPNRGLIQRMRNIVDCIDVSSGGEVSRALDAGWQPDQLSFTGPAKRDDELQLAVDRQIAHVIVESVEEARRLNEIAGRNSLKQSILIRISPLKLAAGFGARMSGKPTQFGIDEEVIDDAIREIRAMAHLRLEGFHIYSGTQCLNADAIVEHFSATFSIFQRLCAEHDISPRTLVIGSGFGIPYHDADAPLDLKQLGPRIVELLERFKRDAHLVGANLLLETGRFIVGQAGCFLTRVISTKISRGVRIAVCDGGMNQHLAAAGHMGSVIHRNYPMFVLSDDSAHVAPEPQFIYGPLCTSIDLLANQVRLPPLKPGDIVAIASSGAYGLSASPVHFISHPPAREIVVENSSDGPAIVDLSNSPISW